MVSSSPTHLTTSVSSLTPQVPRLGEEISSPSHSPTAQREPKAWEVGPAEMPP